MAGRILRFLRRIPIPREGVLPLVLLVAAMIVFWVVGPVVWSIVKLAFAVGLVVATYFLARPEVAMLAGRGDKRPWLVRLREHQWREVSLHRWKTSRSVAYLLIAIAWCLLLA